MISRFDLKGEFPDRSRGSYVFENESYVGLPDEFKELIDYYRVRETERGKKGTTIYHEASQKRIYSLFFCQRKESRYGDVHIKRTFLLYLKQVWAGKKNFVREYFFSCLLSGKPEKRSSTLLMMKYRKSKTFLNPVKTACPSVTGLWASFFYIPDLGAVILQASLWNPLTGKMT